ncbi:hypothetical protein [Mycobacterium bourgelatii]|uniref:Uncharacterized protein n=1 Tax=Mycobacterium bourgelatii TaxID=1273442 RepID=A0A7I9YNZ0_MYCBU|nr:hypothetical protein [Mycobacterium bourgelatii]MCV6975934.1 hypothetical protein [Mycobacterium bourgelatii]GFG90337.1 hypothetical protein MBOU_23790 [Mycobacterium bourgelatii]
MTRARAILAYSGFFIAIVAILVQLGTASRRLRDEHPYFESTWPYGLELGAVLGVAYSVWFFVVAPRDDSFKRHIGTYVAIVVGGLICGVSWAPWVNVYLDSGPEITTAGTVKVIEGKPIWPPRGKHPPSRSVTAVIDGVVRQAEFNPQRHYWHVTSTRSGGSVLLTVRSGFFGIPWIADMSDY